MVLALGTDIARILDNLSLTEVDMLEPKGCDSIVAGARQKDQRNQSLIPPFNIGISRHGRQYIPTCSSVGPIRAWSALATAVSLADRLK
jgi:hypothetical protein